MVNRRNYPKLSCSTPKSKICYLF